MGRALLAVVGLAAASLSCTRFSGDGAPPASSSSGGPAVSSSGGPGAIPLANAGFERSGCAEWDASGATIVTEDIGHGAAPSCRVCGVAGQSSWSISQNTGLGIAAVGNHFYAEAYVRAPDDGARAAQGVRVLIYSIDDNDKYRTVENGGGTDLPSVDHEWRRVTGTFTPQTPGASTLQVDVNAQDGEGGCFLVDDVLLRREP